MIGHNVRVIRDIGTAVEGELRKLDNTGIIVYRRGTLPEMEGNLFIPMTRVVEIIDLGRAY